MIASLLMMLKMISDFRQEVTTGSPPPRPDKFSMGWPLSKATPPHQNFSQWFKHPLIIAACPIRILYVSKNLRTHLHIYFDLSSVVLLFVCFLASDLVPIILRVIEGNQIYEPFTPVTFTLCVQSGMQMHLLQFSTPLNGLLLFI